MHQRQARNDLQCGVACGQRVEIPAVHVEKNRLPYPVQSDALFARRLVLNRGLNGGKRITAPLWRQITQPSLQVIQAHCAQVRRVILDSQQQIGTCAMKLGPIGIQPNCALDLSERIVQLACASKRGLAR